MTHTTEIQFEPIVYWGVVILPSCLFHIGNTQREQDLLNLPPPSLSCKNSQLEQGVDAMPSMKNTKTQSSECNLGQGAGHKIVILVVSNLKCCCGGFSAGILKSFPTQTVWYPMCIATFWGSRGLSWLFGPRSCSSNPGAANLFQLRTSLGQQMRVIQMAWVIICFVPCGGIQMQYCVFVRVFKGGLGGEASETLHHIAPHS